MNQFKQNDLDYPENFIYRDVLLKGRPQHDRYDAFRARHPRMDVGHRAKIFAPFDALKGFGDAVASKDIFYQGKRELPAEDADELNRRLEILRDLTRNRRMARQNRVRVTVRCFVTCDDAESEAYGRKGRYADVSGVCWMVDPEVTKTIQVDRKIIPLEDVVQIESSDGIFSCSWEMNQSTE